MRVNLHLLAETRKQKNVSQEKMAYQLGYKTKGGYNRIENGNVELRWNQVRKIIEVLGLTKDEVFNIFFEDKVA